MTTVSDLKQGDRVRVVFEGEVLEHGAVRFGVGRNWFMVRSGLDEATSIDLITPPAPEWSEREGAVCLDKWGCAWQYDDDKWRDVRHSFTPGVAPQTYADLDKRRGPLTLLHDPGAVA